MVRQCQETILIRCLDTTAHNVAEHVHADYTQFTKLPHATFAGKKLGVPRYMVFDDKYWECVSRYWQVRLATYKLYFPNQ